MQRNADTMASEACISDRSSTKRGTKLLCEVRQQKSPMRVAMGLETAPSLAKGAIRSGTGGEPGLPRVGHYTGGALAPPPPPPPPPPPGRPPSALMPETSSS